VHFIFERALRKFRCVIFRLCWHFPCIYASNVHLSITSHGRGDLELWLQYLDYCEQTGAAKARSRALAQALQIFPRQVCASTHTRRLIE
jgi:hypothetical protein